MITKIKQKNINAIAILGKHNKLYHIILYIYMGNIIYFNRKIENHTRIRILSKYATKNCNICYYT